MNLEGTSRRTANDPGRWELGTTSESAAQWPAAASRVHGAPTWRPLRARLGPRAPEEDVSGSAGSSARGFGPPAPSIGWQRTVQTFCTCKTGKTAGLQVPWKLAEMNPLLPTPLRCVLGLITLPARHFPPVVPCCSLQRSALPFPASVQIVFFHLFKRGNSTGLGVRRHVIKIVLLLCDFRHKSLTSLNLGLLICKRGVVTPTLLPLV